MFLRRHRLALALGWALTGLVGVTLWVPTAYAQDAGTAPRDYTIAPGKLSDVVAMFAATAGVPLSFDPALLAGQTSNGLRGRYTVGEGFSLLLAGSGVELVDLGGGRYSLRKTVAEATSSVTSPDPAVAPRQPETILPAVRVRASAEPLPGDLPKPYAGGQVARGGRLGLLGNVDVMDTPFNISSYTAQLAADQQAETVLDVLKNEPSVRQTAPTGTLADASFNIRGFNLTPGAVTFDALHGMAPAVGNLSIEFAERVEVLKGPSALLYGMSPSGAVGGSVNLVPKRAGDTPLTRLTLGVESDALWKAHVDTGRRFGENNEWGLRFNGRYKNGDRFIDDAKNEGDLGAVALDYRGERLRVSLDVYRLQEKQHGGGTLNAFLASGLTQMPAAPDARTNMYPGVPESKETTQAVIVGGEFDFSDRWTGYAKAGTQRNEFEGPVNFGVQEIQANGDADVIRDDAPSFARTKSAEVGLRGRFQTGAVGHSLALSASYLNRDSGGNFEFAPTPHPTNIYRPTPISDWLVPGRASDVPKTSETTLGGFALADTLGFMNGRTLLTLGVRRQNVKATNFDAATGAVTSGYDASAWTPMVALVVKASDDLSFYANHIQGLSQGTTVGSGFENEGDVFPPYKTRQIEVGAKLQTGSFTNTLSLFQIEQPSTLTDNSTTPLPTLRLNGEQRNRGIEWTTFGEAARGLRLLGGVTYLQGKLTKTQDGLEDGNQAAGTPPWMANLGVDWDVPGLPGLAANGRVTYTSAQYVDSANSIRLPSWTRLDLGVRYATEVAGRPVVFRASVDNVFDRNYWQGVFFNGSVTLGAPRIFRLSASVDF